MTEEAAASKLEESESTDGASIEDNDDTILTSTGVITTDNVGDPSVEINVEDLISELEADGIVAEPDQQGETRKRLEELMEQKRALRELEDFDDYDI